MKISGVKSSCVYLSYISCSQKERDHGNMYIRLKLVFILLVLLLHHQQHSQLLAVTAIQCPLPQRAYNNNNNIIFSSLRTVAHSAS